MKSIKYMYVVYFPFLGLKKGLVSVFLLFTFHFGIGQQLEAYIHYAEQNNPQIQAFELKHTIATEKVNEVNTLSDAQVSFGYFVSEPETRTGAQRARLSVKQMLPWFGTITARENYANSLAETQYLDIAVAKRKLALSISQSYYTLYVIKAKQKVLQEQINLLNSYEKLALTSITVGKASAVSVLQLQIRQNELQQRIDVLAQEYITERSLFNTILNKDQYADIEVVQEMKVPEEDPILNDDKLSLHPELLIYDSLYESVSKSELLNQKQKSPNIGFGLDYVAVSERTDINVEDNGKDILMPMVSISIPVFNKKYNSKTKQNKLKQEEIQLKKKERKNHLQSLLTKAISSRNTARIKYKTQEKNITQAKHAEQILTKNYETGTVDFNAILDIQELQLKFYMSRIMSIRDYFVQSTIINYLSQ
ncbi:TolC family protein [Aquimarina sp. AU474]|uniref:TolC family protein n=1 Tax=Aquimarina sp. AU474 TaxID=2108529 RepID=UPI000D6A0388|nr:TolC family protein [Aquimarina sp. AU474]